MDARVGQDIYFPFEECLKILSKPDEIKQRATGFHIDKQIDIATSVVLAAGDGTEQASTRPRVRPTRVRRRTCSHRPIDIR